MNPTATKQTCKTAVGVHGLRLKRFEEVVAKLLEASVEPEYVLLPPPPPVFGEDINNSSNTAAQDDWLFSKLPSCARVVGNHPHAKRARNKEGQLLSMLRGILHLLPSSSFSSLAINENEKNRPTTIVDFGGGSGHLGIPLALLLPHCKIIVVDFNERSIALLHEKAKAVIQQAEAEQDPPKRQRYEGLRSKLPNNNTNLQSNSALDLACCGQHGGILGNLFTYCGPVEQFIGEPVDVAIALHLCGEATDVCLRTAIRERASSIVVAPCCVGKLSGNAFNPDVFHATGQNMATVSYPQSKLFRTILATDQPGYKTQQDWNALAKAADYSDETEFRTSRNASRRTAKALLETDRRFFLQDHHGYNTALAKMDPLEVTPKNDILVAWKPELFPEQENSRLKDLFGRPDKESKADIGVTKTHLLPSSNKNKNTSPEFSSGKKQKQQPTNIDRNDWTLEEETEIEAKITAFFKTCSGGGGGENQTKDETLVFPTRMGGRKRKLIHFVAERLNLAHWGQGKKVSEKTVAVAKSRPPRTPQTQIQTQTNTTKIMTS